MNIINHLHDKVTEIVSPNKSQNEAVLLKKFYSIVLMRMTDTNAYNELTQDDSKDSDDLTLYELLHSTTWNSEQTADILIESLSENHDVDEDTVERLLIDSTPLIFNQIRLLADNQPVPQYLQSASNKSEDSFVQFIPLWALNIIPSGLVPENRVKDDSATQQPKDSSATQQPKDGSTTEKPTSTAAVVGSAAAALAAAFSVKKATDSDKNVTQPDNNADADKVQPREASNEVGTDSNNVSKEQPVNHEGNTQANNEIVSNEPKTRDNSSSYNDTVTQKESHNNNYEQQNNSTASAVDSQNSVADTTEYDTKANDTGANQQTRGFEDQNADIEHDDEYYIDDSQGYEDSDGYEDEEYDRMSIPLPEPVHADASISKYRYSSLSSEEQELEDFQANNQIHIQENTQENLQDNTQESFQENSQEQYQNNAQEDTQVNPMRKPSLDYITRPTRPKSKFPIFPIVVMGLAALIIWGTLRSCSDKDADPDAQTAAAETAIESQEAQTLIKISTDKKGQIEQLDLIADSTDTSNKVKETLEETFGSTAKINEIKVDPSYEPPALSYAKLTELFTLVNGLPNSELSVSGKVIHFSTADKGKHKELVDEAQNIVSDFSITTDDNDETESKVKPDDKKNSKVVKLPSSKDDTAVVKSTDTPKNLNVEKEVNKSIANSTAKFDKLDDNSSAKQIEKALNAQIINFAVNGDDVPQKNKVILDKAVKLLKERGATIRIVGHTDSAGDDEYNERLSQDRSHAVKKYFMSKGIASKRIKADGLGESEPVETNKTEMGRFKNRRIEFKVYESK